MDELDGNGAAGLLQEVFGATMTVAVATCASCGSATQLGESVLYAGGPGRSSAVAPARACWWSSPGAGQALRRPDGHPHTRHTRRRQTRVTSPGPGLFSQLGRMRRAAMVQEAAGSRRAGRAVGPVQFLPQRAPSPRQPGER